MAGKAGTPATYSPSPSKTKTSIPSSKLDAAADDWIRPDGRGFPQCRPAFLRTGAVNSSAGSAYAGFGNTKVIVSVPLVTPHREKDTWKYMKLKEISPQDITDYLIFTFYEDEELKSYLRYHVQNSFVVSSLFFYSAIF